MIGNSELEQTQKGFCLPQFDTEWCESSSTERFWVRLKLKETEKSREVNPSIFLFDDFLKSLLSVSSISVQNSSVFTVGIRIAVHMSLVVDKVFVCQTLVLRRCRMPPVDLQGLEDA